MCGILGFNWNDPKLAKELADCISHRGPDQDGFFFDNSISFGHRRLSIIDLSEKGRQPIFNEDKTVVIVFNGEIFNYQPLKDDLIKKGHDFVSGTDTEVIVHAYEEYRINCLDHLNGQFAFAIYDAKKRIIFLARDRIGINPLFYYYHEGKFIFGSELKIILNAGIHKEINEAALSFYKFFNWPHRKECIIKNAYKVEPAHYVIFDLEEKKIINDDSYWKVDFSEEIKDEQEAIKLLQERIEESIKMRLMSDVPVGAFLSGGVDSSIVVAIMSKYTKNLNTFSVKFDHSDFDESKYSNIVAELYKTNHHIIQFTASDVISLIPTLVYHYDEPFGDSSMIPTYLVSKVARQYVTVSLSGDGGDELFGGYTSYGSFQRILELSRKKRLFYKVLNAIFRSRVAKPLMKSARIRSKAFLLWMCVKFTDYQQFALVNSSKMYDAYQPHNLAPVDAYKDYFCHQEWLSNAINADLHSYLPDDILTKVDRASLANSLESRPPFLDHELIELACRIDPCLKIRNNEKKYILKRLAEQLLPREIVYRPKKGFAVPIQHYFRNELKPMLEEKVLNFDKHRYFDDIDKHRLFNEHMAEKADHSRMLWTMLMFNLWWERWFVDSR